MKNPAIGQSERRRIDASVARLLSDLPGVEPPLRMEDVLAQMELDLEFYSGSDPSHLQEVVHTIKVAGKKLLSGKTILGRVIKRIGLRGMLFWDDGRILIDRDQHSAKYRWGTSHECGHRLCSWHKYYLLGDTSSTLSPDCHQTIEAEANYASGQISFMGNRFVAEVMDSPMSLASLRKHKVKFGNSHASTLWRMVEEYQGPGAVVGMVTEHPKHPSDEFDNLNPCRYVIQSSRFRSNFANTSEIALFGNLADYCGYQKGGHLGAKTMPLIDDNGDSAEFLFESFCFKIKKPEGGYCYQVLSLAVEHARVTAVVTPMHVRAVRNVRS